MIVPHEDSVLKSLIWYGTMVWGKGASASPHTIIRPICTSVLSCHGELTVAVWLPIHTACPHVKCNISLMPSYVEDRQLHLFKSLRKVEPYGRYVIYFLKGLSFIPICFICKFQGFWGFLGGGVFLFRSCFVPSSGQWNITMVNKNL